LPSDWEVHRASPVWDVPYILAPLYDTMHIKRKEAERRSRRDTHKGDTAERGRVPEELKTRLKKAKGARGLLLQLESEVRGFVEEWETAPAAPLPQPVQAVLESEDSSSDEEIVFIGRDLSSRTMKLRQEFEAQRQEQKQRHQQAQRAHEKCVHEAHMYDSGAAFARYLVHALAGYYGLASHSVTVEEKRKAFVAIRPSVKGGGLPRPLYACV
jgi:hypothetical protein